MRSTPDTKNLKKKIVFLTYNYVHKFKSKRELLNKKFKTSEGLMFVFRKKKSK